MVAVVDVLTAVNEDDWQIAADIREGNISQFLLKPIDYLWYRLCLFFSGRIAFMSMACLPLAVFIFCFRGYFVGAGQRDGACARSWFRSLLTALLQFFISYTMAMLAFWLLEISTFIFILFAFEYLASGHLFPLDLLPPALQHAALLHAVSVHALRAHRHLHGQNCRRGHRAAACSCNCSGCCWRMRWRDSSGGAASKNTPRLEDDSMNPELRTPNSETGAHPSPCRASRATSQFTPRCGETSVTREMSFKGNFLLWIVVELLWFGLQLCFVGVHFQPDQNRRHLDGMAGGAADRHEQFHPANLPGVLPRELHEPVGTGPHGQDGFPAAAAGQHALHRLDAAGGPAVVCQRRVRRRA